MRNERSFTMIVWEKLISHKGAKIESHFEDENDRISFQEQYSSHHEFQNRICDLIDNEGVDTGEGTVIHLLINNQGNGNPMKEAEYTEWQAKEKKDWFHEHRNRHPHRMLDAILPFILIDALSRRGRGFDFGMPVKIEMMGGFPGIFGEGEFIGPTEEEMEEILSDPKNISRISAMEENDSYDCRLCLMSTNFCLGRHASFNLEYLYEALEAFNSSPTE